MDVLLDTLVFYMENDLQPVMVIPNHALSSNDFCLPRFFPPFHRTAVKLRCVVTRNIISRHESRMRI